MQTMIHQQNRRGFSLAALVADKLFGLSQAGGAAVL